LTSTGKQAGTQTSKKKEQKANTTEKRAQGTMAILGPRNFGLSFVGHRELPDSILFLLKEIGSKPKTKVVKSLTIHCWL
jgi:hypothetical protein